MESVFKFWQNVEKRAKSLMPPQVFPAVVKEVDEDMRTCKVRIGDNVDVEDVRLYAVVDDSLKGFCLIPAIDSMVMVGAMDGKQDFYVAMFSEVDKVLGSIGDKTEIALDEASLSYKVDKTEIVVKSAEITAKIDKVEFEVKDNKIKVKADEIVFNDGGNGGLVNVNGLTSQLNAVEKDLNTLKAIFSSWTVAPQDGGATLKFATTDWAGRQLVASTNGDYEDTKVKH